MTITTVDVLTEANRHLVHNQSLPYPAGLTIHPVWRKQQEYMRECIPTFDTHLAAIHFAQSNAHTGFNHRTALKPADVITKAALILGRYKDFNLGIRGLCDSPMSRPETIGDLFGTTVSNIFFWHLEAYLGCVTQLCPEPKHILEIGGGMGELARLFKLAHPDVHYTIVDLPESLFFAEVYLRAHFPDATFEFVPIQETTSLSGIGYDLAINQGSFQEMTASSLEWWLGFLEDSQVQSIYSLNYKETHVIFSNQWKEVYREVNPSSIFYDAQRDWMALGVKRKYGLKASNVSDKISNP